ncbi:uncharacterized protein LOC126385399 isoform X1 [Epinephelus moara]|uniref:uncharacterized protein LOC126385399 isoform X1 n=1 Tax=Epinephelus moara TaxID=300413 RepID=UPI00214E7282|nr:uncharacterized protein LOC126385399 isoform X1 [Epinephelus moara]
MAPQLYITMYKEQFASPGRVKREQLRPTSAHRRNNPQPRPDFLFPWSLQPNYRSRLTPPRNSPPVDIGRPLFPPVKHLSFHSPVTTCPDNYLNTVDTGKPNHMPPVNPSTALALPSADALQKVQLTEPPSGTGFTPHLALKRDYQRNLHPLSAQQLRQHAAAQLRTRPQTSNPKHHFLHTQYRRSCSRSSWDFSSGCYSCFHVVKPYQAGHYIIHPEFVSECLR